MNMLSRKKILTPQNEVILRNEAVQRVNKAKFLGVIVDQHLNWKDHISMISQKISKLCGIIYRICNTLDIKSKRLIYYSLIHPYLTFCMNVWSSTYRTNLKMLCTAQKRSVRALFATPNQKFIVVATSRMIGIHRSFVDLRRRPSSAFQSFPIISNAGSAAFPMLARDSVLQNRRNSD